MLYFVCIIPGDAFVVVFGSAFGSIPSRLTLLGSIWSSLASFALLLLGLVCFGSVRFGSVRVGLTWFGLVWCG